MGADAVGNEATPEQLDAMVRRAARVDRGRRARLLDHAVVAPTPTATASRCASRWAADDELLALCAAVGEHEGTTLEGIVEGCLDRFSDDEIDLLVAMSARRRPAAQLERADRRLARARARRRASSRPSTAAARARAAGSSRSPCRCSCR